MTAKELNTKLISFFPVLSAEYQSCVSWQDGDETGAHVVYSSVFVPYIIQKSKENDINELQKCAHLMELILLENDLYSEEVIAFSVLEDLFFSNELNVDISKFFGKKTRKLYDEVKEWWESKK